MLDARTGKQARARGRLPRDLPRPDARRRSRRYLRVEQPYDCAGSAKVEGLGITLIERIETDDPTSLIGLPLIALTELLAQAGAPVLG